MLPVRVVVPLRDTANYRRRAGGFTARDAVAHLSCVCVEWLRSKCRMNGACYYRGNIMTNMEHFRVYYRYCADITISHFQQ